MEKNEEIFNGLSLFVPFLGILAYILTAFFVVSNWNLISLTIGNITFNQNLIQIIINMINNPVYGAVTLTTLFGLFFAYLILIASITNSNPAIINEEEKNYQNDVAMQLFGIVNFVLPIIITIYLGITFNLDLLPTIITFLLVSTLYFLSDLLPIKFKVVLIIFLIVSLLFISQGLLKEAILLYSIYLFSIGILVPVCKSIAFTNSDYKIASKFSNLNLLDNFIKDQKEKGVLNAISNFITVWTSKFISKKTTLMINTMIFISILICLFIFENGFTIIAPLYIILILPQLITLMNIFKILPKRIVKLKLIYGKDIPDLVLIEQNYKNGYFLFLTEKNKQIQIFVNNILKIEY